MAKSEGLSICSIICWVIAALAGLLAFVVAREPTSFIAALLVGVALASFLGLVLTRLFCAQGDAGSVKDDAPASTTPIAAFAATAPTGQAAASDADGKTEEETATKVQADVPTQADAKVEAETTPDYDKDGVREGSNEGTRPSGLTAARGGRADDLKQIKGIGPKLELLCNELGFFHFDQVAGWTADEVAWVDANLKGFKGRVSRDNWVEQARILAAGGETEFSKRVEDGDVY